MSKVKYLFAIILLSVLFMPSVLASAKYTIKFNGNGATFGSLGKIKCEINKKCKLTANSFKKTGYVFVGWNTKKNGTGISYSNKQKVKNIAKKNKTITLYAQWVKNNYSIVFDGNGSTTKSMKNKTCLANKNCKLTKNSYTREGYMFVSWNTKADGSGINYYNEQKVKNITSKTKITLYAKWEPIKYTIVFNGNGATSGTVKNKSCTYGVKCKLNTNKYQKNGYTFVGWNVSADGSNTSYTNNSKVKKLTTKNNDKIILYAMWVNENQSVSVPNTVSKYAKNYDFMSLKRTNDFVPHNKSDLKNIIFTAINNGWNQLLFYCPSDYIECIKDFKNLSNEGTYELINSFVSTYNTYDRINSGYTKYGQLKIEIFKKYSDEKIKILNNKANEIIANNINNSMSLEQKIKAIHDYIVNNTTYNENESSYDIFSAYGTLIQKNSVCQGYVEAMSIFLDMFGVKNYTLTSKTHAWNGLYINRKWLHLDATFDDPISNTPVLRHTYFLIDNNKLNEVTDSSQGYHNFDKNIYAEFNY